jgi:hypothetical protein
MHRHAEGARRARRHSRAAIAALGAVALGVGLALPAAAAAAPRRVTERTYHSTRIAIRRVAVTDPMALARADAARSAAARRDATAGASHGAARAVPFEAPPGASKGTGSARMNLAQPAGASKLTGFAGNVKGERGFDGITAAINGSANSPEIGGVGDVSPPDQGLAVGPSSAGTVVVEFVNDTFAIYSPTGRTLLGAIPSFQVFGLPASAFLSDPRVYFDAQTGRWFLTQFTVGTANSSGQETSPSTQYVAVSQTESPFGPYSVFSVDTTDASTANCPCFGDYDQVGANAYGFYISTNEFSIVNGAFNGTVIYAVSKQALETAADGNGPTPSFAVIRVPYASDPFAGYHLAPAEVPPGQGNPGVEYFVESNANTNYGTGLEVFSLLGTAGLASGGPLSLVQTTVGTESYSTPPNAYQKSGPTPYGTSIGYPGVTQIETDFDAVQEVTWAGGDLYAELDTGFNSGTTQQAAADWFVLHPTTSPAGFVKATLVSDGSVRTSQSLLYPDVVVNAKGMGEMDFAISGTSRYPSAGYIAFDGAKGAVGPVRVAAAGVDPLDDFTCYPPFGPACRYGDYSGGQFFGGRIYMATEYVGPQPRDNLSDWGTRVWSVPLP